MVYTYSEIISKYNDDYNIRKALFNEQLYKIDKGIYSENKFVNPLIVYAKKYPKSIVTMDNAFYYYNLTDVIPSRVYLATASKSRVIKKEKIVQLFLSEKILEVGKETVIIDGQEVFMYNKERLLIELIRLQKRISFDYYKEIIANYRTISYELDMCKIEKYLTFFKESEKIFDVIQREVF